MNNENDPYKSILGDIEYHDYIMLICYMDSEWTRKFELNVNQLGKAVPFKNVCQGYYESLNENREKYNETNKKLRGAEAKAFAPYLYAPLCFMPFGRSDELGIVLLDDFDPISSMTSLLRGAKIEKVNVAFCPKNEKINDHPIFCDFNTLVSRSSTPENKVLENLPLLTLTEYKFSGLIAVGEGVMFQQALYKAMAKKIIETQKELKNTREENSMLISEDDIDSFRCIFLDMQDSAEIGTLIFCKNYSVAMTIIEELRTLTIREIISEDKRIEKVLNVKKLHKSIVLASEAADEEKWLELLKNVHVFQWTSTNLSVNSSVHHNNYKNCNGKVHALGKYRISPCHLSAFEDEINKNLNEDDSDVVNSEYRACQIGFYDSTVIYSRGSELASLPLVPIPDVVNLIKKNTDAFSLKNKNNIARTVTELATDIIVPIPKTTVASDNRNHLSLSKVLRKIQKKLFQPENKTSDLPVFDFSKLYRSLREIRMPNSLGQSIICLYRDYENLIANPFVFDAALDLYDALATLYNIINWFSNEKNSTSDTKKLQKDDIIELAEFVDGINNALWYRAHNYSPEDAKSFSCDVRGSLKQITLATDAAIKCGLGVTRRYVLPKADPKRNNVGGVMKISSNPNIFCKVLNIGNPLQAYLTIFSTDVVHAFHPGDSCEHFHETFHLVYGALKEQTKEEKNSIFWIPPKSEEMKDIVEELFVMQLTLFVLFQEDTEKWTRHWITRYTRDIMNRGSNAKKIINFAKILSRTFLAIYPISESRKWNPYPPEEYPCLNKTKACAKAEFEKFMVKAIPFFSEYEFFSDNEKGNLCRKLCIDRFKKTYKATQRYMPQIWEQVRRIYMRFAEDNYHKHDDEIKQEIKYGMEAGIPFIRNFYENPYFHFPEKYPDKAKKKLTSGLDPLVLIAAMVKEYISNQYDDKIWDTNKEIHLSRYENDAKVNYETTEKGWNRFQIAKNYVQKFSVDPDARQDRIRRQIVFIKTCWDISTNLRGRRLFEMLEQIS